MLHRVVLYTDNIRHKQLVDTLTIDGTPDNDSINIGGHILEIYNTLFNHNDPYMVGNLHYFPGNDNIQILG